jgi:hypothetical protein
MKVLRTIRRVLALAVALWAVGVAVFFLVFAKVSYQTTSATGVPGQPPITATTTGQVPWISQVGALATAVMLAFSMLLAAAAFAEWRGVLAAAIPLCFLSLAAAFITGFSIGGLYFPGAAVAFLGMLILAIEKILAKSIPPST